MEAKREDCFQAVGQKVEETDTFLLESVMWELRAVSAVGAETRLRRRENTRGHTAGCGDTQ